MNEWPPAPRVVNGRVRVPVRLEFELYQELGAACGVLGVSMNEALADAAACWLAQRCTECPELAEAVRRVVEARTNPPMWLDGPDSIEPYNQRPGDPPDEDR